MQPDSTVEPGFKPASPVARPLASAQQPIEALGGKTLYEKNADERRSASTLIVLDGELPE